MSSYRNLRACSISVEWSRHVVFRMSWSGTTRKKHGRVTGGVESDVTDGEWALIEPLVPKQGRMGRPRETDAREVFNAIQ